MLKTWPPKKPPARIELSLETQLMWREIPRSQIKLGNVKGEGCFGVVYEGTIFIRFRFDHLILSPFRLLSATWNLPDGKIFPVAVKALRKGSTSAKKKFLQEAATMRTLRHKNLVRLYGIVSGDEP